MHVFEVGSGELLESIAGQAAAAGIADGAIVSLIGAVDAFTVTTMSETDATKDQRTYYTCPAELSGTGEIRGGAVHIHAVLAVAGDKAIAGHLLHARVETHCVRAYVLPALPA
ncbi:DUF296 domain-containing protein [Streptomyces sp. NPDC006733]|uniref:PCC domain-containing protein n=1 Tax=Streptomyces sp. NPDC006733 TaxID=3155460 RepID=UPI00340E4BFF